MKLVIQIFCLPYEIDDLENTLNQLRRTRQNILIKQTNGL